MILFRQLSPLILILFLLNCSDKKEQETIRNKEIFISEIILDLEQEQYLSSWVDSISYISLETTPNNLLPEYSIVSFTPEYIFYHNYCFNWDGRYFSQIGSLGQGPCEEPGFMISNLVYTNDYFYSCGMSLIEYDNKGNCTGKTRNLFRIENQKIVGNFANIGKLMKNNQYLIGFNFPDRIYFFNNELETIADYPVMDWDNKTSPHMHTSKFDTPLTYYNDTVVFYNYLTDTVYHIINKSLIPQWVIKLDEKDKLSSEYMYKNVELMGEAFEYWQNGKIEQSEICKMVDNKIIIPAIYETTNKLYVYTYYAKFAPELRDLPPQDTPFIICIDKSTEKISGGKKMIDNMTGLERFFPTLGIYNNKMIDIIWPHELHKIIKEKQKKKENIDPSLIALYLKTEEESNPILIVAHLKNQ